MISADDIKRINSRVYIQFCGDFQYRLKKCVDGIQDLQFLSDWKPSTFQDGLFSIAELCRILKAEDLEEQQNALSVLFDLLVGFSYLFDRNFAYEKSYDIEDILKMRNNLAGEYDVRRTILNQYEKIRHKLRISRRDYYRTAEEGVNETPPDEREDTSDNCILQRADCMIYHLFHEGKQLQIDLLCIFEKFYHTRLERKSATATIKANILRLFNAVVNLPELFCILPFYIFIIFTQRFDLMTTDITNEEKQGTKFYPRLFFKAKAFSEYSSQQYTALYEEITEAVNRWKNIDYTPKKISSREEAAALVEQLKTPFHNAGLPIIISEALLQCLKERLHLNEDKYNDYWEKWEDIYIWKKRSLNERSELRNKYRADKNIASLLLDIQCIFTARVHTELTFHAIPSAQTQAALKRVFKSGLITDTEREDFKKFLQKDKITETSFAAIEYQHNVVSKTIQVKRINLSPIAFRTETHFYDSLLDDGNKNPFEQTVQECWDEIVDYTYEHLPAWLLDQSEEYLASQSLKKQTHNLRGIILKKKWTSQFIMDWLRPRIEQLQFPCDHHTHSSETTAEKPRFNPVSSTVDGFGKIVFKEWLINEFAVPDEIKEILNNDEFEADYLLTQAFHEVLKQALQILYFEMMQTLCTV